MASFRSICTRAAHNEGRRLNLDDNGNWLLIRGNDSDAVHEAMMAFYRARADAPKDDAAKNIAHDYLQDLEVLGSMVCGWSFEEECTPEAVREMLETAPVSLRVRITNFAFERAAFLASAASSSSDTPKQNSD